MSWQIPVFLRLATAYIAVPILMKKIVSLPSLKQRFCWQYFFCFLLAIGYAILTNFNPSFSVLFMVVIGLFNSLAAYAHWRAVEISLSKTSLLTQADDLIGLFLGYLILNETKFLNSGLIAGVLLCFGAVTLIILSKRSDKNNATHPNVTLMKWVAIYSIIWGIAVFAMRYFALENLPSSDFLLGWYGGSFLGSLIILFFAKNRAVSVRLTKKGIMAVSVLSCFIWISMVLGYWGAKLAPITVFQPIYLISEAILPTFIGLLMFKEAFSATNKEKIAYVVGIAGAIAVALSYQ